MQVWQRRIYMDATLQKRHDVEGLAEDRRVLAEAQRARHRHLRRSVQTGSGTA